VEYYNSDINPTFSFPTQRSQLLLSTNLSYGTEDTTNSGGLTSSDGMDGMKDKNKKKVTARASHTRKNKLGNAIGGSNGADSGNGNGN
jgi:hypothetical protein